MKTNNLINTWTFISYCQILYKDDGKDGEDDDGTNSVADEKIDMQELESKFYF